MKENIVIYFVVICTLIFVMLTLFISILAQRYKKNQINHKDDIDNLKTTYENDKLLAQVQVQESTFQFISREIHDNIGQKLSLAKLHLNNLVNNSSFENNSMLREIVQILSESLNDLRDLSRSMSSDFIANNGLIKTIENEIAQLNKSDNYNFKLTITGDSVFLKQEKDVFLFRIVQESLANIIKHAEATQIHIKLHYTRKHLQIEIIDNGIGFNPTLKSDSNGIKNIISRAKLLDGYAEFISVPGDGTIVKVKIPIYDNE